MTIIKSGLSLFLITLAFYSQAQTASLKTGYPMIYSSSYFDLEEQTCEDRYKIDMIDIKKEVRFRMCEHDYRTCVMEGSCQIRSAQKMLTASYIKFDTVLQRSLFEVSENPKCPFGYSNGLNSKGKRVSSCRDPFFSVAADYHHYKVGDVLFISQLKGFKLPDGQIHDGFVIVRDTNPELQDVGEDVIGFYTGRYKQLEMNHPLRKIKMIDTSTPFKFRRANLEETQKALKNRNFPLLPKVQTSRHAQ